MRRVAGLMAVLGLALTGCGSSSLSSEQLRGGATRTCRLARIRTDRITTPTQPSQGTGFLSRGIAALAPMQSTLIRLRPPDDLSGDYRIAVHATGRQLAALRFTLASLKAGNDPIVAIKTLQARLAPLEAEGDAAWRSLKIPACELR